MKVSFLFVKKKQKTVPLSQSESCRKLNVINLERGQCQQQPWDE